MLVSVIGQGYLLGPINLIDTMILANLDNTPQQESHQVSPLG